MRLQGVLISFLFKKKKRQQTVWEVLNVFSLTNWITHFHPVIVLLVFQDAKEGTFILVLGWRPHAAACVMDPATGGKASWLKWVTTHGTRSHESLSLPLCLYTFCLRMSSRFITNGSCLASLAYPGFSWSVSSSLGAVNRLHMSVQQAGKEGQCSLLGCLGTFVETSLKWLNERGIREHSSVFLGVLMGRKSKKEQLYVYKWLICFALQQGITIPLWSSYTPIKVN